MKTISQFFQRAKSWSASCLNSQRSGTSQPLRIETIRAPMTRFSMFTLCVIAFRNSFLFLTLLFLFNTPLHAQESVGPFISTVGTTSRETGTGRDWAYLLWTANSSALLDGRTHAIYSKPGDANAAAPFTRVAIVSLQSEAVTLTPLIGRAALLGEDTNTLHSDIDALFGKFVPANLSLPEKLSAVVRGAIADEKHYGRLVLLSRAHPSVAMAVGFGHAERIGPGQTTFEVREFDRATQTDVAVIGRVTVTAGAPTLLPAPGVPIELPRPNPRGHLNAQLRWSVPDPLRRLSLLQHGYNVWRVRKDFAESRNWHVTPPNPTTLVSNHFQSAAVQQINRLPLLVSKTFNAAEAANVSPPNGDTNTFFIIDDNNRGNSNIITTLDFTNGARFYYFVTARDILGRDGLVSAGTEVQICNRLPPDALSDVEVINDFAWQSSTNSHRLRIVWPQAKNLPLDEQRIGKYWVYRWTNINEMRLKQHIPTNNRIAVINHVLGKTTNSYLDNGANAPSPITDMGKTFWYTVRAEDDGACGGNLSPNSAPAFGILRDRVGPAGPTGKIEGACFEPEIRLLGRTTNGTPATNILNDSFQFSIVGFRGPKRIEWMEFRAEVRPVGSTNVSASYTSGRRYFTEGPGGSSIIFLFDVPDTFSGRDLHISARAGFGDGSAATSAAFQNIDSGLQKGDVRVNFLFAGELQELRKDIPCDRHFTVGTNDTLIPIEITVTPTAGSKELRVYRRVDDGPLDLVYQKPLTTLLPITFPDDTFPHGGGKICYYASVLDEHGNASPLTQLGCTLTLETAPPPRPQLSPITPIGASDAPQMLLSWFCPSANLDRFEVGIAAFGGTISSNCAPGFLTLIPPPPEPEFEMISSQIIASAGLPNALPVLEFQRFLTPRPSGAFGDNNQFTIPVDIETGRRYVVYVKSIALSGARSDRSNIEVFFWQAPVPQQPDVPWPARSLPPVGNSFGVEFGANWMLACGETNILVPTVRIAFNGQTTRLTNCPQVAVSSTDPNLMLPTNSLGESLFPVVLYRQQVTNSNFPTVSGDVVQVTPMMESIAWGVDGGLTKIFDPYVLLQWTQSANEGPRGMFLRDTQPVISGSRYRYLLVRFNALGEIAETIPVANELEVP